MISLQCVVLDPPLIARYKLIVVAIIVAATPPIRITIWSPFRHLGTKCHFNFKWNRGGRMKASTLVARLPTKARHKSNRGIPMATPHDKRTRIVLMKHTITVYITFQ